MSRVPKYRKHANGQAFVQLKGHRYYLGKFGSEDSKKKYAQFIERLAAHGDSAPALPPSKGVITIVGLIATYDDFARTYYSDSSVPTKEYHQQMTALSVVEKLFGEHPAHKFGPRELDFVQQHLVSLDLARTYINHQIGRIKRFFRWASRKGHVPPDLYHGLLCVDGLRRGRSSAREPKKITPVSRATVEATLKWLAPTVATMVQVQLICGMRPAEVCIMRGCDINRDGDIWLYRPTRHKNDWRGHERVIAVPKAAQALIAPLLSADANAYIFSPRDAEIWRYDQMRETSKRKTKVYPCELARLSSRLQTTQQGKKRRIHDHYDTYSYRRAITYGLDRAKKKGTLIPRWHPNQLRHTAATEISQLLGQQAAQRWLGHEHLETTSVYAESQVKELLQIARILEARWA